MKAFNVVRRVLTTAIRVFISLTILAACTRDLPDATLTSSLPVTPGDFGTPLPPSTPLPFLLIDANPVMSGICFESAYDASGRTFVLRSAEELNSLFDESDNSGFCRRPSVRGTFDFSGGRAVVGAWSRGRGCDADHRITAVDIDDVARTFIIRAQFLVEGDCPYELVRPLWLGITGYSDYDIRLLIAA
jgi:hypothetical protein